MAIEVKHKFISGKGDGSDSTLVRPSNWNDGHNLNMATSKMIARLTVGDGPAEEFPVTSYMIGLMNTADQNGLLAALGLPSTGDAKLTMKITPDTGWIMMNDSSIGDASSGATRNNPDTVSLFTLLYNVCNDVNVPLLTSTGLATTRNIQGTAAQAYAAHCRIVLPKALGRSLIVGGSGSGLTTHALGSTGGAETHVMTPRESLDHLHRYGALASASDADRYLRVADVRADALTTDAANAGVPLPVMGGVSDGVTVVDSSPPVVAPAVVSSTSGAWNLSNNIQFEDPPDAVSLMQPWTAWNIMIKL
jgi:hypothetical protein